MTYFVPKNPVYYKDAELHYDKCRDRYFYPQAKYRTTGRVRSTDSAYDIEFERILSNEKMRLEEYFLHQLMYKDGDMHQWQILDNQEVFYCPHYIRNQTIYTTNLKKCNEIIFKRAISCYFNFDAKHLNKVHIDGKENSLVFSGFGNSSKYYDMLPKIEGNGIRYIHARRHINTLNPVLKADYVGFEKCLINCDMELYAERGLNVDSPSTGGEEYNLTLKCPKTVSISNFKYDNCSIYTQTLIIQGQVITEVKLSNLELTHKGKIVLTSAIPLGLNINKLVFDNTWAIKLECSTSKSASLTLRINEVDCTDPNIKELALIKPESKDIYVYYKGKLIENSVQIDSNRVLKICDESKEKYR